MSYAQQVNHWLESVDKAAKRVLSSKHQTRKFMKDSGILAKNGKKLAKAYR